ncbi:hypothetical protein [Streptomyces sp. NPDC101237]
MKVAIVTGAGSGIGRSAAIQIAKRGNRLFAGGAVSGPKAEPGHGR